MIASLRYRVRLLRETLSTLSRPRCWMPLWLVLSLGLLNPAACLVHCAPSHAAMHAAFGGMEHEYWGFLCSVPQPVAVAAPAPDTPAAPLASPDPSSIPRAVFACALLGLWLLPLLRTRRHNRCAGRPSVSAYEAVPLLRPPRTSRSLASSSLRCM